MVEKKLLCDIHLTVSSLSETSNFLELNWNRLCDELPDWIGLFTVDPGEVSGASPLLNVTIATYPHGNFTTDVPVDIDHLPGGWDKTLATQTNSAVPGPHCFSYWIASFKSEVLQESNCLKIQPTWMQDNREGLNKLSLDKFLLPGTHDSGSFQSNASVADGLKKMVYTQSQGIWSQLVFGIRYLDFRIGYYMGSDADNSTEESETNDIVNEDRFWLNHDFVRVSPLVPLLREIKLFSSIAKNEIIILDIHRLPVGFYLLDGSIRYNRHEQLIKLIKKELGDLAVEFKAVVKFNKYNLRQPMEGPNFEDILETGKRIIICYPEEQIARESTWLWPSVRQMWGNKQDPEDLKSYVEDILNSMQRTTNGNPLWAVMAQLTPSAFDIIFKPDTSLRKLADSINRNLTEWVSEEWWMKSNIIATDFFLGNDIIRICIESIPRKLTVL